MDAAYKAWISNQALQQIADYSAEDIIVFAYLLCLTTNPLRVPSAKRIAKVSGRSKKRVQDSMGRLERAGVLTSQWLGFQRSDYSRKARVTVHQLNTLHELKVPDAVVVVLFLLMSYERDGFITSTVPEMVHRSGWCSAARIRTTMRSLMRRNLLEGNRLVPFLRK